MKTEKTDLPPFEELFPFNYAGGGYFRKKGVKVGDKAPILHGMDAIKYLYERLEEHELSTY